jgi:hypothetical protein
MHDKMRELKHGPVNTTSTLKEYLSKRLPYHTKAKPLAPKTAERYESLAAHATRALGSIPLKDLTPFLFDDVYVKLAETLSPKTVREVHSVIHVALKRAVKTKLIPPSLIEYLKLHREQQEQHRTMFSPDYRTDLDLIFADPAGDYLKPSSVTRAAVRLARKAGLSDVGLHTLRHTHASALLHAGVPIASVSKRLGHRDPYTTAKIYAHAIPDTDQDVAATWDKFLGEPEKKPAAQNGTTEAPEKPTTPLIRVV